MRSLKYSHSLEVVQSLPEPLLPLRTLAYNYWWTWNHEARSIFRWLGRETWEEVGHNPVELLHRLDPETLDRIAGDEVFVSQLSLTAQALDEYMVRETWFDREFPGKRDEMLVAYFSAEFGVSEALPIYSGGLGVLAGDHLKATSDLGVPLVGVGLLYARGYFRQSLSPDGWQQEQYPRYDFHRLPLTLVRDEDGSPTRISIQLDKSQVLCQVWLAQVGRVKLFLLDSNLLQNEDSTQGITDTLYGGDAEMRLRQEAILGVGGYQALRKMGYMPTVCHMNEGHSALQSLERIRDAMQVNGVDFRTARQATVAGNVFTTHTPVPAGFDLFEPELTARYLGPWAKDLKITDEKLHSMGRLEENGDPRFNMAALAMANSCAVNGVSQLHAEISRSMFAGRWPDLPLEEVPVDHVTNGIHTMTWMSRGTTELFDNRLGPGWRDEPSNQEVWDRVGQIPDREIWEMRENERGDLVRFCRRRLRRQLRQGSAGPEDVAEAMDVLDPRVLTIGFARRFATYKRADLILKDRERLKKLLNHPDKPVQIVFAGKSHPKDDGGKQIIQELHEFIREPDVRKRVVFIQDYDMAVARRLIQGVDVWLNNPRRPFEASGTSGMKVVPNGGLNCSILDGWWAEGFEPGAGWRIGNESQNPDEGYQDWLDSRALYHVLENDIVPTFYFRTEGGLPTAWIEMIRLSWQRLAHQFSAHRMVQDYTSKFYVPGSDGFLRLSADGFAGSKAALEWRDRLAEGWSGIKIVQVSDDAGSASPVGSTLRVSAELELGKLSPDDLCVQALFGHVTSDRDLSELQTVDLQLVGSEGGISRYEGSILLDDAGQRGYVVRAIPRHDIVSVRHELPLAVYESSF
ncbi:MAG: alpha-glucan family phosphorylase [Fimbriimonadaceae bacterium]|nr:alpha-glucan family phosphorylase [Fimbriimonadaceae bacterium]